MKKLIIGFLKFIGRLCRVDLYDKDMVFHIEKRYKIEKIDSENAAIKKLKELASENNSLTSQLHRCELDHEGSLLREQSAQRVVKSLEEEVAALNKPQPSPIWQDPDLEKTSKDPRAIKERNIDVKINFRKRNEAARAPTKFNKGDAGYDLYCPAKIVIGSMSRHVVDTGIIIDIPRGYYGRITTRGSVSWRDGVNVLSGIVDSGFQNTVKVIMLNTSRSDKTFSAGDRVAQIIIEKAEVVDWVEGKLDESSTDSRLIGSTGE